MCTLCASTVETFGCERYGAFYGLISVAVSVGSVTFNVLAMHLYLVNAETVNGPGGTAQHLCTGSNCFAVAFGVSAVTCLVFAVPSAVVLLVLEAASDTRTLRTCLCICCTHTLQYSSGPYASASVPADHSLPVVVSLAPQLVFVSESEVEIVPLRLSLPVTLPVTE